MKAAERDITLDKEWSERQTLRLLGYEILRHGLNGEYGKMGEDEFTSRTGAHYLEAGTIFNQKFLPRLMEKLNLTTNKRHLRRIRKAFDEIQF